MNNVTEVELETLPKCNFCEEDARYDAKTTKGPWAYMCERHWSFYGSQKLGTGKGQRLVLAGEK